MCECLLMMNAGTRISKEEFPPQDGIVKLASAQRLETSRSTAGGFPFLSTVRAKQPEDVPLNTGVFTAADIAATNRAHDRRYGWSPRFSRVYTNLARFPETVIGQLDWNQSTHQIRPV